MRVFLAFDKFKDALSADAACRVAANTLRELHPDWEFDSCPLADGGEGFAAILTSAVHGKTHRRSVTGPRGGSVEALIGLVTLGKIPALARSRLALPADIRDDGALAVIELASASGLSLLEPPLRDPWQTSTFGTGELIRAANELGAAAILLGVGGSATNDLGLGAMAALGLEFRSANGTKLGHPVPADWKNIARIDGVVAASFAPIRVACDVANPLFGAQGSAAVYGPQKGLPATDLPRMETESARLALMLCTHAGRPAALMDLPGAGAAGGIAFGLMAATGAALVPGFDLVADWLDLDRRIAAADLILTGEGRFDATSLNGKGPGAIVSRARSVGREIHVFAGAVAAAAPADTSLHAITPVDWPLEKALASTPDLLRAAIWRQFSRTDVFREMGR